MLTLAGAENSHPLLYDKYKHAANDQGSDKKLNEYAIVETVGVHGRVVNRAEQPDLLDKVSYTGERGFGSEDQFLQRLYKKRQLKCLTIDLAVNNAFCIDHRYLGKMIEPLWRFVENKAQRFR